MIGNILSLAEPGLWEYSLQLSNTALTAWLTGARRDFKRVVFVGHGSSLYNGQVGKYVIEHIAHLPAEAVPAFAFGAYVEKELLGPSTLVVGISATGATPSVLAALARAREAGSPTIVVTAQAGSVATEGAQAVLLTGGEGDTISVKTSSYVLALVPLYMLALALSDADDSARAYWEAQVREAGAGAARFLNGQRAQVQALARTFESATRVFVVGSGSNIGTAGEGALKVIEMAKMYAESQELEEFFHGRLREVDQVNPMFFLAPGGRSSARALDYLTVMNNIESPSVVLTDAVTRGIEELAAHVLKMPAALDEYATPLLYAIPLHLFGYELALLRGVDPTAKRYEIEMQNVRYGDKL
jgi:glucosamine--fructose-6-phosphate aminotransferase (isomerizing)